MMLTLNEFNNLQIMNYLLSVTDQYNATVDIFISQKWSLMVWNQLFWGRKSARKLDERVYISNSHLDHF